MVAHPAFFVSQPTQPDLAPVISSDLDGHAFQAWPDVDYDKVSVGASGSGMTDNLPIARLGRVQSGEGPIHSFEDDYYYRIHLIPTEIDLGNLVSDQLYDVEVWNAYFTVQNLNTINITGGDGLLLTAPVAAPTDYQPLESRMHTLEAFVAGPPVVDASYTFDFPSEDPVLTVVGIRVAVWPFGPRWDKPVIERLSWLTDILEAYDGTEQGRELRSVPRKEIHYNALVFKENRQHLDSLLWGWQSKLFLLPIPMDVGVLNQAASIGATAVYVDTEYMAYHVGGYIVLYTGPTRTEAAKISAVDTWGVTLEASLVYAWPKGALAFPADLARIKDTQAVSSFATAMAELSMQFELEDTANVTAVDSTTIYRSYPVLETPPNWRDDVNFEYRRIVQRLDNQLSRPSVNDTRESPVTLQSYHWTRIGRAAIASLRAWLHARKGRLNPLWIPTFTDDITLHAPVLSVQSIMTIKRREYYRYLIGEKGRRDIAIFLNDGNILYKRITSSTVQDAETEELVLSSTMGQDVSPEQVVRISFLRFSRLESDAIELSWQNTGLVECNHMVRGLPDDV